MTKSRTLVLSVAVLSLWLTTRAASAETVELVTYYPTNANTGDLHVGSLTVGNAIRANVPPDRVALIFDELGIGLPPGTTDPAGPLHVVGLDGVVSPVVFMPAVGAGSDIRVGIGTQNPRTRLEVAGTLTLQDGNGAGVIYFRNTQMNPLTPIGLYIRSDDDPTTFEAASERVFIGANGNVGIGTTAPESTLHVTPAPGSGGRLVVDTSFAAGGEGGEVTLATATPVTTNPTWHMDTLFGAATKRFRIFRQPNLTTTGTEAVNILPVTPFDAQGNPAGYNLGIGRIPTTATPPGGQNFNNLDVNDVWLRGANRWASRGGGGPTFINPVTVYNNAGNTGTVGWTTVNASGYVPAGARAVILEAEAAMPWPDVGAPDIDAHIKIRVAAGNPEYVLLRGRAACGGDCVAWANQGTFPIAANRRFQFTIENPGFDNGAVIRVIGYYS